MNADLTAGFVIGVIITFILMMGWWAWLLGTIVVLYLICYVAEYMVYRQAAHGRMIGGNWYWDKK